MDNWLFRIKFVDDLFVVEVILRCLLSIMFIIVNEIMDFVIVRKMCFNFKKCKEILFDFL